MVNIFAWAKTNSALVFVSSVSSLCAGNQSLSSLCRKLSQVAEPSLSPRSWWGRLRAHQPMLRHSFDEKWRELAGTSGGFFCFKSLTKGPFREFCFIFSGDFKLRQYFFKISWVCLRLSQDYLNYIPGVEKKVSTRTRRDCGAVVKWCSGMCGSSNRANFSLPLLTFSDLIFSYLPNLN